MWGRGVHLLRVDVFREVNVLNGLLVADVVFLHGERVEGRG